MKWPEVRLESVALSAKGSIVSGPFGSNISAKYFVDDGIPVIRGNNLTIGGEKFVDDGFVFITEEKAQEFRNCEAVANDLVFTAAGTIGQVGIIPQAAKYQRYIISNKQLRLRCDLGKVNPMFAYYWLSTPTMADHIIGMNTGSTVPLINLSILKRLPLPLPPLDVQSNIVDILSAYDDLIENNRRRMALLENAARMIYQEWFVRLRFPGHEKVRIVDGIPEGWGRVALEEALVLQRGFDLPSHERKHGLVRIYGSTGIIGYHNETKAKGPGVVTGRSGSLGVVSYAPDDFWPHNTALWVKEFRQVSPLYALHMLRELHLEQYNGGASVPTLDRKAVHRLNILLPNRDLVCLFDEFAQPSFAQIRNMDDQNRKLQQAREMLLPKLMSGEIEVSGDPTTEPRIA